MDKMTNFRMFQTSTGQGLFIDITRIEAILAVKINKTSLGTAIYLKNREKPFAVSQKLSEVTDILQPI